MAISEKLIAGLVTAAVIAPVCAVCVLGPAVLASIFAGIAGWLGGFDMIVTAGLVLVLGITVYGFIRRRGAGRTATRETGEASR